MAQITLFFKYRKVWAMQITLNFHQINLRAQFLSAKSKKAKKPQYLYQTLTPL